MSGETNLTKLLKTMEPKLASDNYVFVTLPKNSYIDWQELNPKGMYIEEEGITLIITTKQAEEESIKYQGQYSCITLNVHSSLEAVGLTAAFATALANDNISANVVAAYYHDHIFVCQEDGEKALACLQRLSTSA